MDDADTRASSKPPAQAGDTQIARPLHVLAPLIADDLRAGQAAAARAGLPHYQAAGDKLREAKTQLSHGEFLPWVKRHFGLSIRTAQHYMQLAAPSDMRNAFRFSSLREAIASVRDERAVLSSVVNALHQQRERLAELEAFRDVQRRIIDVGYKALAHERHPDKGGSADAMARLNKARDALKHSIR